METLATILTSKEFLTNIPSFVLLVIVIAAIAKLFKVQIKTEHIQIGGESKATYYERTIVREQCDFTHTYLMGLLGKIEAVCPDHTLLYDGYFSKYILELAYDEFVKWINYNHITDDEAYIMAKQAKICALVYAQNPRPEFKTPEFQARMERWVAEIIHELVHIRKVYTEQMKK